MAFNKLSWSLCKGQLLSMSSKYRVFPKKMLFNPIFEFQTLGGEFLWVKNNSKNKKDKRLFNKIISKWTLFVRKIQKIMWFFDFMAMLRMEIFFKWQKSQFLCLCKYKYWIFWLFKWFLTFLNWQNHTNSRKFKDFD